MPVIEWDDDKVRYLCREGTKKQLQAYLDNGYVQINGFPLHAGLFNLKKPKESQALIPPPAKEQKLEEYLFQDFDTHSKMTEVASALLDKHCITMEALTGNGRSRELVVARREFCYICYFKLGKSTKQIGNFIDKDHSTVVHHLQVVTGKRSVNYYRAQMGTCPAT